MEEKKQYSTLTIDRAAFLLLRVKKAFKKKKLQRKEREQRNAQLAASRVDQRASCAGLEDAQRAKRKQPPPLLRSRTLPAIIVPGVSILQAQIGNIKPTKDVVQPLPSTATPKSRFYSGRMVFARGSGDETPPPDGRRKSAVSKLCVAGGHYGPERAVDGGPLLRIPAFPVQRAKSPSPNSGNAFNRLSKLLNQSKNHLPAAGAADDTNIMRRLSWERKDITSRLPRSASIDSMVETVWAESFVEPLQQKSSQPRQFQRLPVEKRASVTSRASDRTLALVSPSVGRRLKGHRSVNALFAAIEHGHMEKARTILESTDVDVNCVNSDGLSALDVAVLNNNRSLVKMLINFGAKENSQYVSADKLGTHLKQLLSEAEMRLQEFGGLFDDCTASVNTRASFSSIIGNAYPSSAMTGCAGGDNEKQAVAWGRRAKTLKRLVLGFNQARPPDPPSLVTVDITGTNSVALRLQEPTNHDSPITTKFKVQWSTRADFNPITGEAEILDMSKPSCHIDLTQGRRYFFRACCGNLKGYGGYLTSTPASVVPSTWHEVDEKADRFIGKLKDLDALIDEVRSERPGSEMLENQAPQRRGQKKKTTIKQLFTAASKFQKHLRRGIYLACILYHEDKVLVTNEDFLPVIEIDETFPSCINNDLHWFMKVTCNWDDTKSLRADMERHASPAVHFRTKLLSAALQMQSALCLQDLGQLYYKPVKDRQGTLVLSTINYIKSPKNVSVLNSRWLPMSKVKNKCVLSDEHNIFDLLMASIQEQINYHQVSSLKLNRGLYLAYLKMQSSVDLIQVVVSMKNPNMLPHCKIRDNAHVSAEEWSYLKNQNMPDKLEHATEQQRTFLELVTSAAKRLFNYMDISSEDTATHRLYDSEIIDLTPDVSFLVICPSVEFSCSVPGQREILLQRGDLLSLPLQVFEMIHLNTYHSSIIQRYSKLSCVLELDAAAANHLHREAFSNSEVAAAKEKVQKLQELQTKLNSVWRCVRWLMDVIAFARDKNSDGVLLRHLLDQGSANASPKCSLLQIPPKTVKSSPGRGSWPGPASSGHQTSLMSNEFSKSEQQLCNNSCSDEESRKNSESFTSGELYNECLVPSRSEDMLFAVPSMSTASPLIHRPIYTGSLLSVNTMNKDSMHSLSSESDSNFSQPLNSSTPNSQRYRSKIPPSRSLTSVKQNPSECSRSNGDKMARRNLNMEGLSKSMTNISEQGAFKVPQLPQMPPPGHAKEMGPGILQVYAAYETGLASGTSLKLHVTPKTTAREVVDLVVKQLNMAVVLKGKEGPIYPADKFKNFCLVAVIGARERCLRDDFRPLQLQNPWKKGRLYVRMKQDVLAALEHSTKHSAII
ncbi:ankyrin repeat and fibronectin type-III domain-containing protein 1 isoform X2 [Atheta coriaria]|uniref:ankyrin repeat and fibronectin type-III domain-containing protein 1 isoform X2 n=1 Tax=Dalotia coriaria TaxID=877792 RepID=UPI0031F3AB88